MYHILLETYGAFVEVLTYITETIGSTVHINASIYGYDFVIKINDRDTVDKVMQKYSMTVLFMGDLK